MARDIYLALGDSITAGFNANNPRLSFVGHVSQFANRRNLSRRTLVIAKNGWTTRDIWTAARSVGPLVWRNTNVLTLMSGGNDLRRLLRRQYLPLLRSAVSSQTIARSLQEFEYYFTQLCDFVSVQDIPHVVVPTVYNPIPNSDVGVEGLKRLNDITRDIANRYKFGVVGVYEAFLNREPYLIDYYRNGRFEDLVSPFHRPIHPNNAGHRQIADLITAHLMKKTGKVKKPTPGKPRRLAR